MNVRSFEIGELAMHDVPLPRDDAEVLLTDATIELDSDLKDYFRDKIVNSLVHRGLDVVADPNSAPTVREGVATILTQRDALVPISQAIAQHLFAVQNKSNSAGLLAVATGSLGHDPAAAVLKLEREQGLRLQIIQQHGKTHVDVEHLRNLTLTEKTKVFKTSILMLARPDDPLSLIGCASDDQRGIRDGEGVAEFFLSRFLGCQLAVNPQVATRNWITGVETFINSLTDQERQAEYHIAMLATLQSQRRDISARAFARENIRDEDLQAYRDALAGAKVDPESTFQKDLALARSKGFKWYFEHGMTLVGRRDDVESGRVKVRAGARASVEIYDPIKAMKGL